MNKYRVAVFQAHKAGIFEGVGEPLDGWVEGCVTEGYRMVRPALPVANQGGVYVVITMEAEAEAEAEAESPIEHDDYLDNYFAVGTPAGQEK